MSVKEAPPIYVYSLPLKGGEVEPLPLSETIITTFTREFPLWNQQKSIILRINANEENRFLVLYDSMLGSPQVVCPVNECWNTIFRRSLEDQAPVPSLFGPIVLLCQDPLVLDDFRAAINLHFKTQLEAAKIVGAKAAQLKIIAESKCDELEEVVEDLGDLTLKASISDDESV